MTTPFYISKFETTQGQYTAVTGMNPSQFKGPKLPVESISWNEAQSYCQAVGMRLPTEADVQAAEENAKAGAKKGRDVWIDFTWALINSPEFLLRH